MKEKITLAERKKSEYQMAVIQKIRTLRQERGASQLDLSAIIDVTYGQIGNIESANQPHKYTLSQISRICREYGYSISQLFTGNPDCTKEELVDAIVRYEEGE